MKTKILTTFFLVLFSCRIYSQWVQLNPLPMLQSVAFSHGLHGIAVGDIGTVLQTYDGGNTWIPEVLPVKDFFDGGKYKIFYTGTNTWYLANFFSGQIYKSTDDGISWDSTANCGSYFLGCVYFINPDVGFVGCSKGIVMKTDDGGVHWEKHSLKTNTSSYKMDISFANLMKGFLVTLRPNDTTLYITDDGGNNWTPHVIPDIFLYAIYAINQDTAFAAGYQTNGNYLILRITNDGNHWEIVDSSNNINTSSICFPDHKHGIIVGLSGKIYKSDDWGSTWHLQSTLTGDPSDCQMYFINRDTGFIVGQRYFGYQSVSGAIYKTTDGGNTWFISKKEFTYSDLKNIDFSDGDSWYAVGNNGLILRTTDGGSAWDSIPSNTTNNLNSVFFTDKNTGFITGDHGLILKTDNGGDQWQLLNSGVTKKLNSCYFLDNLKGFIAGDSCILKTIDGGLNWIQTTIITYPYPFIKFTCLAFRNKNIGFAAGGYYLYKTTDGGNTWDTLVSFMNDTVSIKYIKFLSDSIGYLSGYVTYVSPQFSWNYNSTLKTEDGGQSWSKVSRYFYALFFNDEQTGYGTSGDHFSFAKTKDGWLTWEPQSSIYRGETGIGSINFYDKYLGYLVGGGGSILKTSNGGEVGIKEHVMPLLPTLLSQNYPNPYDNTTTIRYNLPSNAKVTLEIYNVMGKKISTPVSGEQSKGEHQLNFGGSNLAPGIYFYTLTAGNLVSTKKMIMY